MALTYFSQYNPASVSWIYGAKFPDWGCVFCFLSLWLLIINYHDNTVLVDCIVSDRYLIFLGLQWYETIDHVFIFNIGLFCSLACHWCALIICLIRFVWYNHPAPSLSWFIISCLHERVTTQFCLWIVWLETQLLRSISLRPRQYWNQQWFKW